MPYNANTVARLLAVGLSVAALAGCTTPDVGPLSAMEACPNWANDPPPLHSNAPSDGFGCANRANLLNTVDRPADLASGESLGPANGERAAKAVGDYEKGEVKPFLDNSSASSVLVAPTPTTGAGAK